MGTMLAALFVAASGCEAGPTEIVVVVDTDMAVPADIDRIDVMTVRGGGAERLASRTLDPGRAGPTVAVLRHEGGPLGPLEVTAIGTRGGAEVLRNAAIASFVEGEQLVLELPLLGSCRARSCGPDETCDHTGCRPVVRDELAEWTGTVPRIPADDCEASCPDGRCRDGVCCTGCFVPTADGRSFECREGSATTACGSGGVDCAICDCSASDACVGGACAQDGAFTDVSIGLLHACAVHADGRVFCWGNGNLGRLGVAGAIGTYVGTPSPITTDERFTAVASGFAHTCAITRESTLYCWGNFDGRPPFAETPVPVETTRRWIAIAAGRDYTCGITRDRTDPDAGAGGEVWCFGGSAALGRPGVSGDLARVPAAVDTALTDWVAIEAGSDHACALRGNGELFCWGENDACQVEGPPSADVVRPVIVRASVRDFGLGDRTTCVVDADGSAWCWGRNLAGETGTEPASTDAGMPELTCDAVSVAGADALERVETADRQTYALRSGGILWRWPPVPAAPASPAESFMSGWEDVDGYDDSWCAMRSQAIYCWGENSDQQLGIGDVGHQMTPQRVCVR